MQAHCSHFKSQERGPNQLARCLPERCELLPLLAVRKDYQRSAYLKLKEPPQKAGGSFKYRNNKAAKL